MTKTLLRRFDNYDSFFIGFDKFWDQLETFNDSVLNHSTPNYPPYNIVKTGESSYAIDLAVAGFGEDNLEIELEDNVLTITGTKSAASSADDKVWKGIAEREFTRSFRLVDSMVVKDAVLKNGMLRVQLEEEVPEVNKKKININSK